MLVKFFFPSVLKKLVSKYIDNLDHGMAWKREEDISPVKIKIHSKIVKKAFYQNKKDAAAVLRFYFIALHHFSEKGHFKDSELAGVLTEYYGYSYNNRGSILRLNRTLQEASGFFIQTSPHYFTFKSRRRLLGLKKNSGEYIKADISILSKNSKKAFADCLIYANASGQGLPMQNLCNQTGYKRSRVFEAVKDFQKSNIKICINSFSTGKQALKERHRLYHEHGILTEILFSEDEYKLYLTVGNNFATLQKQDISNGGIQAQIKRIKMLNDLRSSLNSLNTLKNRNMASGAKQSKVRITTVFQVISNSIVKAVNVTTGQEVSFIQAVFLAGQFNTFMSKHEAK